MKKIIKFLLLALITLLLLFFALLAWGWFNSDIKPQSWVADANPGFYGKFARNGRLDAMRFIPDDLGVGPEDVAVAADGQLYTGVENGQIFSIDPVTGAASLFADTGGRPLGMEFDHAGNLIVADADRGLLKINPAGDVSVLIESATLRFADDVDIAADGTIWFSNASRRYGYGDSLNSFLEGEQSGELYSYSPGSDELILHMEGLFFANGVTLGPDDNFVLVSETGHGRIHRLWLNGPSKGRTELFASGFPGVTDNISFNGRDTVWVALPALRDVRVAQAPGLRRILSGLPSHWWMPTGSLGFVLGLDMQGEVIHNLQFSEQGGKVPFSDITSVKEFDGRLYLGSLVENRLGVIDLQ